jgi:hypothetical protein
VVVAEHLDGGSQELEMEARLGDLGFRLGQRLQDEGTCGRRVLAYGLEDGSHALDLGI